jgi:hypothetical protein
MRRCGTRLSAPDFSGDKTLRFRESHRRSGSKLRVTTRLSDGSRYRSPYRRVSLRKTGLLLAGYPGNPDMSVKTRLSYCR